MDDKGIKTPGRRHAEEKQYVRNATLYDLELALSYLCNDEEHSKLQMSYGPRLDQTIENLPG